MLTTKEIKKSIRLGPFAWPGGYPLFYLMEDGETMCPECVREEWVEVCRATRDRGPYSTGWRVQAVDINYEDDTMFCCNCNGLIESAYGGE